MWTGDGGAVEEGSRVLTIPDIFFDNWKRGLDLEFWNFLNKLEYSICISEIQSHKCKFLSFSFWIDFFS